MVTMKWGTAAAMLTLALAAAPAVAQTTSSSSTIVNLQSFNPANPEFRSSPVTQTFGPGTYDVRVIGKAAGGQYDPYSFASPAPGNYKADYSYTIDGVKTAVSPFNGQRFADAAAALAAYSNIVSSFTLDKATAVSFIIDDNWFFDNQGGLSLGINRGSPAAVPEPGTMALFGLAGGAMLAMRRRKKAAAARG